MLDKSLPYRNIIMRMDAATVADMQNPELPGEYAFSHYREGDGKDWAALETAVLEFDNAKAALAYFQQEFLTDLEAAKQRVLFIRATSTGRAVATASAWFQRVNDRITPVLHWVSVHPDFQGTGLGRAVVKRALTQFSFTEPGLDVYLHTQTWSYPAVCLYASLGFRVCRRSTIYKRDRKSGQLIRYPNDYMEAMQTLSTVLNPSSMERLITNSVE